MVFEHQLASQGDHLVQAPLATGGSSVICARDREGENHEVALIPGMSLMRNLRDVGGLPIAADCGGNNICGTCHVYVDESWSDRLPPAAEEEVELLEGFENAAPASRLSCQIGVKEALDGLRVTLAPEE